MRMQITFPGGARVAANYKGHDIETDQPLRAGGGGTAPAPFDYFLASIGTCAGYYVKSFLDQRQIPAEGVRVGLETVKSSETKRIEEIRIRVAVPEGFPRKYERALVKAVDLCSVKRHILEPPRFSTTVEVLEPAE